VDYDIVMGLPPNRVLVVGAGKSGLAAARFCALRGAHVTVTDMRVEVSREGMPPGISWELGGHRAESFTSADLIVVSPGVPEIAELKAARARGVPVTGEIELASRFVKAPLVAVTGTNGKSTVTALAGEIARHTGRPTFVGGNLGTPLVTAVGSDATSARGLAVVELSSFQLETCETLHPRAAALLNLTPDHLDRYPSMEAYGAAKLRVAAKMGGGDVLVVNADDPWLSVEVPKRLGPRVPVRTFSLRGRADGFVDGSDLVLATGGAEERYPIAEMKLIGRHNLANALASLLLMRASALATREQARAGLAAFRPLPHRMELVGEKRGVRFYDDSKATNVDSVVAGIAGFPLPYVIIAGGRDKGAPYDPMVAAMRAGACQAAVLIGEAADKIADAIGRGLPIVRAADMKEAVREAAARAPSGGAVVLSPACSSYDMFDNYEHRGRVFRACVEELPNG
jgi:UDP-N-acetylmuramoylalanine--D-glutamate ligase